MTKDQLIKELNKRRKSIIKEIGYYYGDQHLPTLEVAKGVADLCLAMIILLGETS